ncbi:hypothetical protein NMY22_g7600 [Coprinellus aureogranulatus]|nr:hypothetical protein NMY22_g7600 [Coprinellus aureogranulatus]
MRWSTYDNQGSQSRRQYQTGPGPQSPAMPYGPGIPPPLKGIKVLDLTRVLAGPTATMLLADLGADVIKVEEVTRGDDTRSWLPPVAPTKPDAPKEAEHLPDESAYFLAVNRNKRSMTVNFKTPEGLEIVHRLVKQADILVENFVSGKLASMGLGYEDCKKLNPKLQLKHAYSSHAVSGNPLLLATGYGQTGPYQTAAGYDVVIEGEAGLMHITGEPDGPPCKVGVAATDIATGLYAHGAIMAGLISRQQTGEGVWIDCNLFETQIAGLANIASNYLIAGKEASRHGTAHPSIVPYQVFPCKDGFVMIGAGNNKQFKILAEKVLERPDLATDPRFSTNDARVAHRTELVQIINDILMQGERDFWLGRLTGLGAVRTYKQYPADFPAPAGEGIGRREAGDSGGGAPPIREDQAGLPSGCVQWAEDAGTTASAMAITAHERGAKGAWLH